MDIIMVVTEKGLKLELVMPSAAIDIVKINYYCHAFSSKKKISSLANDIC